MLECEMFSVGPVPECGVPSWDMCFMELFTQSVNNRAAAAPLKTECELKYVNCQASAQLQDLSHLICFFGKMHNKYKWK